jgi:very-short-patch-repair endonuclease
LVGWVWRSITEKSPSVGYRKTYTFEPVEDIEVEQNIENKQVGGPALIDKSRTWNAGNQNNSEKSNYFKKHSLLTKAEDNFYKVLDVIAKENNYIIQTKVRLEGLIGVRFYAENWYGLRNRIKSREMDFVLCEKRDSSLDTLLVIELDDSSHQREDRIERDRNLDHILHEAGLPILHIPVAYSYDSVDLVRKIKEKVEQDN